MPRSLAVFVLLPLAAACGRPDRVPQTPEDLAAVVCSALQKQQYKRLHLFSDLRPLELDELRTLTGSVLDWNGARLERSEVPVFSDGSRSPDFCHCVLRSGVQEAHLYLQWRREADGIHLADLFPTGASPYFVIVEEDGSIRGLSGELYRRHGIDPGTRIDPIRPGRPDYLWKLSDYLQREVAPKMRTAPNPDLPDLPPLPDESLVIWSRAAAPMRSIQLVMETGSRGGTSIHRCSLVDPERARYSEIDLPTSGCTGHNEERLVITLRVIRAGTPESDKPRARLVQRQIQFEVRTQEGRVADWDASALRASLDSLTEKDIDVAVDPRSDTVAQDVLQLLAILRDTGFDRIRVAGSFEEE